MTLRYFLAYFLARTKRYLKFVRSVCGGYLSSTTLPSLLGGGKEPYPDALS
jgi:hypothetical protein